MGEILQYLDEQGIPYEKVEHPPVFTCEQSERLVPPLEGKHTKNLFLRDKKGRRHILVAVGYEKQVDLKALAKCISVNRLSMASEKRLLKYLGVTPGSVTLLGLVHDTEGAVEVVIDEAIWRADKVKCHPLVNTATVAISHQDLARFIEKTGHFTRVLEVPAINKEQVSC